MCQTDKIPQDNAHGGNGKGRYIINFLSLLAISCYFGATLLWGNPDSIILMIFSIGGPLTMLLCLIFYFYVFYVLFSSWQSQSRWGYIEYERLYIAWLDLKASPAKYRLPFLHEEPDSTDGIALPLEPAEKATGGAHEFYSQNLKKIRKKIVARLKYCIFISSPKVQQGIHLLAVAILFSYAAAWGIDVGFPNFIYIFLGVVSWVLGIIGGWKLLMQIYELA